MSLETIVTREDGVAFVDMCGDTNHKLHKEGDIVQGVYLAALCMKEARTQLATPELYLTRLSIKFRNFTRYQEPVGYSIARTKEVNGNVKLSVLGKRDDDTPLIECESIYSKEPELKYASPEQTFSLFQKNISPELEEIFRRTVHLPALSEDMKKVFLASFITGALCNYFDPNQIPEDKAAVFLKKELEFYRLPENNGEMTIAVRKTRDCDTRCKVEHACFIAGNQIIGGYSLFSRIPKEELTNYLRVKNA